MKVETLAGVFGLGCGHAHQAGEKVNLLLRPSGVHIAADGNLRGVVADVVFHQDQFKVTLENGLYFHFPEAPKIGEAISISIPPSAVHCLA